jgi:succinate dehydrogenase / fumarate reductase, iron-sulfur subunit
MNTFILKIFRGIMGKQYWEEFELTVKPFYNIISVLMDIQKSPINRKGEKVEPIAWEQGCLEEVCGSCSMLINGRPRQACTALIQPLLQQGRTITCAPMTKFPLLRDLVVNRDTMFEDLKRIHAWIDIDTSVDRGFGPPQDPKVQEVRYMLSTCMTCGCCVEACPQVNPRSKFIGPAAISQVRLFNTHPTGNLQAPERLRVLMDEGGISNCGNAQNCAAVCPKKIPLTESIAVMGRKTTQQALKDLNRPADV